ncbi:MAG: nuclease-related domain-containing protein [Candidatus Moranbacteria bacterium]|jgi:hypothetical protein|nr:nuclease-related domain-containing protein [Candidatus Moranbacteria bacterium]
MNLNQNKEKRSPLKNGPLRNAGQSLNEKIIDKFEKDISMPIIMVLFVAVLTIFEWVKYYTNSNIGPWFYTIILLVFFIYSLFKIIKANKEISNIKLGRDGERQVAESLEELKKIGYRVYHDILGNSFNIDHIAIGPAGAFTIETKTYRKKNGQDSQIYYNGDKVSIDGFVSGKEFKNPIEQARGQKYWLEGFINDNVKVKIKVTPVVIFPGWFVNNGNNNGEVLVFNDKAFVTFIKNKTEINLDKNQIDLIATNLEGYVRNF